MGLAGVSVSVFAHQRHEIRNNFHSGTLMATNSRWTTRPTATDIPSSSSRKEVKQSTKTRFTTADLDFLLALGYYGGPKQYYPQQNSPGANQPESQANPNNGGAQKTGGDGKKPLGPNKKPASKSTPSSTPRARPTLAPEKATTESEEKAKDAFKAVLIENLKDEDFIMETPSAAIFTLIVGE